MNYQIIVDEHKLREFINWLPELESAEQFYYALFARNKYLADKKQIKSDKICLKRGTSNKEYLYRKLQQLEVKVGSYTQGDIVIPQEALALYISVNPRNLELAAKNTLKAMADCVTRPYDGYNPHAIALSEIAKSCTRKVYYDLDFDVEDVDNVVVEVERNINKNCVKFLKTHSGVHCLVELKKIEKQFEKSWYKALTGIAGCDVRGDNLIPVPGCVQGGRVPRFYE